MPVAGPAGSSPGFTSTGWPSPVECVLCGLTPFDLPDGIDPEFVFEHNGQAVYCQACLQTIVGKGQGHPQGITLS